MTTVKGLMGKLEISRDGGNSWTEILGKPGFIAAAAAASSFDLMPQVIQEAAAYEEAEYKRRARLGGVISMPGAITPLSVSDAPPEEPLSIIEERRYSFPEMSLEVEISPEAQAEIKRLIEEAVNRQSISILAQAFGTGMVDGIKSGLRSLPPSFNRFWADDWSPAPAPANRRAKRRALKHRIDKRLKAKRRG